MIRRVLTVGALAMLVALALPAFARADCRFACPPPPDVSTGDGALTASYFEVRGGSGYASNNATGVAEYHWRLRTQCGITDPVIGACNPGGAVCQQAPDRVITYYIVQSQRLARVDGAAIDGQAPPPGTPPGTGYGQ